MAQADLWNLRYFVAVAEERSVGAAARRLHIAQPSLSVRIKNLEQSLNTRLFDRGAKGMELTPAGAALYGRAREALNLAAEGLEAAAAIGRDLRGRLDVGLMGVLSYMVLPRLTAVLRDRMADVDVQFSEINAVNGPASLLGAEVAVALCIPPIKDPAVACCSLGSEPLMVAVREDSQFAAESAIPLRTLQGWPRIGLPALGGEADRSVVEAFLRANVLSMPIAHRARTATSALGLVLAGEGVALLPRCAALGAPKGVVFRHIAGADCSMEIGACWRSDMASPLIDQFVEAARSAQVWGAEPI